MILALRGASVDGKIREFIFFTPSWRYTNEEDRPEQGNIAQVEP